MGASGTGGVDDVAFEGAGEGVAHVDHCAVDGVAVDVCGYDGGEFLPEGVGAVFGCVEGAVVHPDGVVGNVVECRMGVELEVGDVAPCWLSVVGWPVGECAGYVAWLAVGGGGGAVWCCGWLGGRGEAAPVVVGGGGEIVEFVAVDVVVDAAEGVVVEVWRAESVCFGVGAFDPVKPVGVVGAPFAVGGGGAEDEFDDDAHAGDVGGFYKGLKEFFGADGGEYGFTEHGVELVVAADAVG